MALVVMVAIVCHQGSAFFISISWCCAIRVVGTNVVELPVGHEQFLTRLKCMILAYCGVKSEPIDFTKLFPV